MDERQLTRMLRVFQRALDEETVLQLARDSGFTQRLRTIEPLPLVASLLVALGTQKAETIADILRTFNALSGNNVAYKPFHKKLAKDAFPELMRQVVEHLLSRFALRVLQPRPGSPAGAFRDIVIQDGSSFALKPALRDAFRGRFTKVSPAAVEVHATFSLCHDEAIALAAVPDSEGERHFRPRPDELEGKLLLADRGYQDVDYCQAVAQAGGSVIIRHQTQINPNVVDCHVGGRRPRGLRGRTVQQIRAKLRGKNADIDAEWFRNDRSRARLRVLLLWNAHTCDHIALVTNLSRPEFPPTVVAKLYRLRWQVELLFKEWKSYANLHAFDTAKAPLAEGLIWASLATAIVKRFLAHATELAHPTLTISTRRTAMALAHHFRPLLSALIAHSGLRAAFRSLLAFLSTQAQRAHPHRDRDRGRLQTGLSPTASCG